MPKKHGTVRTAARPSGYVNHDWFGLFQSLNDVVHFSLFFSFFFFPKQRHSETAPAFFFFPPIRRRSALSQNHSSDSLKPFLISQPSLVSALSQKSLSNPLTLKSSRRCTVAAQSLRHSLIALCSSASLPRRRCSAA